MDPNAVMNWDALGQIDIVTTNDTANLQSLITSAHDRPVAIIFSPGPVLGNQVRGQIGSDVVTQCGGNYNPANYLEPNLAAAILDNDTGSISTYFTGAIPTSTSPTNLLAISTQGKIVNDGTNLKKACTDGTNCSLVANDKGLAITSDVLFGALRKSSYFRTDINSMLDRMVSCLRDEIAAGGSLPSYGNIAGADTNTCYGKDVNPQGYYPHYKEMIFVAAPGSVTVAVDGGPAQPCAGALLFAGQRDTTTMRCPPSPGTPVNVQKRGSSAERNDKCNYLEGENLTSFTGAGTNFSGQSQFAGVSATQPAHQDIVRCVPAGASLTVVAPTVAAGAGNIQLAAYSPGTSVLTLGSVDTSTNYGANPAELFACAWTPEIKAAGSGFRSYFRFRIRRVDQGFTFAVIDGDRNGANVCGAARQHLGYSGDSGNVLIPNIAWPKLAIEFDTSRNAGFSESGSTLSNGRNDPCYTSSCGGQGLDNSSHVAVVYWGYGAADATIPVTQPLQDDNVHGFPWPPDTSARPAPRNPAAVLPYVAPPAFPDTTAAPGVAPLDRMGSTNASQREFHARLEVTRGFTAPTDAKNGVTSVQVQFWIEPHPAASISAMTYNAGSPPTLTVTTSTAHGFATGNTVVIKDTVPTGYNGEYPVTVIDANNFTATLPSGKANPGRYISSISWANVSGFTDRATVTSAAHGLNDGDSITIAGAIPTIYNGTHAITRIDADSYRFDLELDYQPGTMAPAVAAAKTLTPRATALANTTRPMSELYPAATYPATAKPLVSHTATIYDEQKGACAASAPLCPNGQSCGSDNMCYQPSFRNLRLGFTVAERATTSTTTGRGQLIEIRDRATTWLP
jgi:hypothetical protein